MPESEDFVEVNVQPLGSDSAFEIDLRVQDTTLNPDPFTVVLGFQLEEGEIPGLNDDATNEPDQLIELAKGLLLCGSEDVPELTEIPVEECPPDFKGVFYDLEIEMELDMEAGPEVRQQNWQVSIFFPQTQKPINSDQLFLMLQEFFEVHL
jgi:hypothetical protein